MTKNVPDLSEDGREYPKKRWMNIITVNHYAGFNVAGETPRIWKPVTPLPIRASWKLCLKARSKSKEGRFYLQWKCSEIFREKTLNKAHSTHLHNILLSKKRKKVSNKQESQELETKELLSCRYDIWSCKGTRKYIKNYARECTYTERAQGLLHKLKLRPTYV